MAAIAARRRQVRSAAGRGRRIGSVPLHSGRPGALIDFGTTLNAALVRHAEADEWHKPLRISYRDLHCQVREQAPRCLVIFLLDTSDSMGSGPEGQMSAALGAALSLAGQAYLQRDQVSLITFRDRAAEVLVPPTASVVLVRRRLQRLPVGGATPLAAALEKAGQVIGQARLRDPQIQALLVLISDGEATVPLQSGGDPVKEALAVAERLKSRLGSALLIDTRPPEQGPGLMPRLAAILGAACHHLYRLRTDQLLSLIATTRTGMPNNA